MFAHENDEKLDENIIFMMKFLKSDNINRIVITLTDFFYWYFDKSDSGLEQTDHINRMITLTVITLSGFYCIMKTLKNDRYF